MNLTEALDFLESRDADSSLLFPPGNDFHLRHQRDWELAQAATTHPPDRGAARLLVIRLRRTKEFAAALIRLGNYRSGMNTDELLLAITTMPDHQFIRAVREACWDADEAVALLLGRGVRA